MAWIDRRRLLAMAGCLAAPGLALGAPAGEGYVEVPGGQGWWRRVGSGPRAPLLTLHGGPGAGHDYLLPLAALADQRPVIFYDQLGAGRSRYRDDPSLWRIERFVEEVHALRAALGLERLVLFGHSWGGWLSIEYLLTRGQAGVEGLVLSSTSASGAQFAAGTARLVDALPDGARLRRLHAEGRDDPAEYGRLVELFNATHLLRMTGTAPDYVQASNESVMRSPAYIAMNGPNEFEFTGSLKGWDRTADLGRIAVPTLITRGEFDEFTPDCADTLRGGIAGSRVVEIPGASHLAMDERPEAFVAALRPFLARLP